jgi:hypothetical protein
MDVELQIIKHLARDSQATVSAIDKWRTNITRAKNIFHSRLEQP